jgi:hypothetical protein
MFDEPQQQEADPVSFEALLRRASQAGAAGQQVIIATSLPESELRGMLRGSEYTLLPFDGHVLSPA